MSKLDAVKPLYDLGFAIHLLKPRSKVPVESKWTTGPRKAWDVLRGASDQYNVGVRLGRASRVGKGYLAVIDCDVKDPAKLGAMEAVLVALRASGPIVLSGRGNGSRHVYVLTAEPMRTRLYRREKGWEISFLGDGAQVVLPPSIHPDTGKAYKWATSPRRDAFRLWTPPKDASKASLRGTVTGTFKPVAVDLVGSRLASSTVDAIITGEGVSDRSSALLGVCNKLIKAGFSDDEVLSVLTNEDYFLGQAAYDHAQTRDRGRAAEWVRKYTLEKSKRETKAEFAFDEELNETELTDEQAAAQAVELFGESDGTPSWHAARDQGFYKVGDKGGRTPLFGALLEAFKELHPFKTIADMKTIFVFNGTHYTDVTPIEVKAFAEAMFMPKPEDKLRSEFHHKVLANHVTRRSFFMDSTEGKVNFKNGVLDLSAAKRGRLVAHSPDFGFRGVLPYDYDRRAQCPVFREWIKGAMLGDPDLVSILQEYMGYVIRGGEYKYHKALWLGGVGRNGKSTFIDVLKALIGAGNFSVISIKALMNDKFAGADLDGKIANFSEETSPQELSDSGPFKNLTGDGDLFAQKKYGDPYSFRNRAKLIMTYNTIPDLKDLSPGMLSRPLIVPFEKIISEDEADHEIKRKLSAELPGIFNFALEGWQRLEAQGGFTKSQKSALALKKVREESCPVYQWVEHYVSEVVDDGWSEPETEDGETGVYRPHELHRLYCQTDRYSYKLIEFCRRLNSHPIMARNKKRYETGFRYENLKICL